jgi:integrase
MNFRVNIGKQHHRRKQRDGSIKEYDRYVVGYTDPKTGQRTQRFFEKQKDAYNEQRSILLAYEQGLLSNHRKDSPTVAEAFDYWIENRRSEIKPSTLKGYKTYQPYIVGPLLAGTKIDRFNSSYHKEKAAGRKFVDMLGPIKITELTTADIRLWHKRLTEHVGIYTASRACQRLSSMMALIAEDYSIRPPVMPKRLGKGRRKEKKSILTPEQVGILLRQARKDNKWGLYYAFPFLTGVRPSEMLGLKWSEVDFERNTITIRRMLEKDGTLCELTKTEASRREIPMWSMIREWMLEWRIRCPRRDGELDFVFPSQGAKGQWPLKKIGGGTMLYSNYRIRVWVRAFKKLEAEGITYVTPHSARHCFISTLQAQGVEVGLVAKLAGHSDPSVTLGHYTQAVRDGTEAIERLNKAYSYQ